MYDGSYGPYVDSRGFAKMFWGELFVFIDIRVGGFDLFPDLVGLLLIVVGVYQLAGYQEHFESLKAIVILRMILSLGDIVTFDRFGFSPDNALFLSFLLGAVGLALSLLYYYHTLMGVRELAGFYLPALAQAAQTRWSLILICNCLGYLFSFLSLLSPAFLLLTAVAAVAMLILSISFMQVLWRSYKGLR